MVPTVDDADWITSEFATIALGDKRLQKRIITLVKSRYTNSLASIPQSTGSWDAAKGAYRFFDNTRVEFELIITPHQKETKNRISDKPLIIASNDTTCIKCASEKVTNIYLHPTIAFTSDGLPLGLLHAMIWTRNEKGTRNKRKKKPIEDKESFKWVESYNAVSGFQEDLPDTQFVHVSDREGDVYDLFERALSSHSSDKNTPYLLVRASWDRRVEHPQEYLWKYMESQPIKGKIRIEVPRKKKKKAREAELSVRYAHVVIKPPRYREKNNLPSLVLWVVFAHEESPPSSDDQISWMLITTVPVKNMQEALEKIKWYTLRWGIEVFFRVLKSGCNVEKHQLKNEQRLFNCIAIDCIIAWRILFITLLGRYEGNLPSSVLFEEFEWKALMVHKLKIPHIPQKEPTLHEMVHYIAKLGGFLGRKRDGFPGATVLWRGLIRLNDIADTFKIMLPE